MATTKRRPQAHPRDHRHSSGKDCSDPVDQLVRAGVITERQIAEWFTRRAIAAVEPPRRRAA